MNKVQETNLSINWELGYMRSFFEVQEDSRIDLFTLDYFPGSSLETLSSLDTAEQPQ